MTDVAMLLSQSPRMTGVHLRIVVAAWAGWCLVFTTLMSFMWLAPLYRVDLKLDDNDLKWVRGVVLGASGLGGLLFGLLADVYGRRTALLMSLMATAGAACLLGFQGSRSGMLVCGALLGFGMGGQWASGQMLLSETMPPPSRRLFAAVAQSGAPFGLALSAFLSFDLAPRDGVGWRAIFLMLSGLALLVPLTYFLVPESDLWRRQRSLPASARPGAVSARDLLRAPLRRVFILAFLLTLACQANYWCTVVWLPEFMKRTWSLELLGSAHWTYVFAAGSLAGYLLFAVAARAFGARPAFVLFCTLMAIGVAMITVFSGAIRAEPSLVLLFALISGIGTGLWSFFGPFYADVFPTALRATAAGACMNITRGFQLLAPVLVREVGGEKLSTGVALAAAFAGVAAALVLVIPMRPPSPGS